MRRRLLVLATCASLLLLPAVPAAASPTDEPDPFPLGFCVRSPLLARPLCVYVDR